jgi:hypothetical protein
MSSHLPLLNIGYRGTLNKGDKKGKMVAFSSSHYTYAFIDTRGCLQMEPSHFWKVYVKSMYLDLINGHAHF